MSTTPSARERFDTLLRGSVQTGTFVKLTLGKVRSPDPTLRNVFVRPVRLQAGARLSFVWRHTTRDLTRNLAPEEGVAEILRLLGADFLDAHLFTIDRTVQYETRNGVDARLAVKQAPNATPAPDEHDRERTRKLEAAAPWLQALGVTNAAGRPREGMAGKLRQIQKFAELIDHLLVESGLAQVPEIAVTDMGCGKGYLTFALAELLKGRGVVTGIESRPALVETTNRVARDCGFDRLNFVAGDIAGTTLSRVDVLVALHACDTATDDALAKGVEAGAKLLVVSPCCHKELRPQLVAPAVLAEPLRHGIFLERQAEFVTDALRALLLEWAGYRTKVFEFVSTEHTAKNLMIAAIREHPPGDAARLARLRALADFYGIRRQRLAEHLNASLQP
jgi:precorrin-6B methylase 2